MLHGIPYFILCIFLELMNIWVMETIRCPLTEKGVNICNFASKLTPHIINSVFVQALSVLHHDSDELNHSTHQELRSS
ncbi:hypothetical protein Peur_005327 [Populus x canadensis]